MHWLPASRVPSGQYVIRIGAALILASVVASTIAAWELHATASQNAWQSSNTVGALVAEQTRNALQSVDLTLQDIQGTIAQAGVATPDQVRPLLRIPTFRDVLSHRLAALPLSDAITVVGPDGRLINTSRSWPVAELDVSDRDYFTYFRSGHRSDTYISRPAVNRATHEPMIFVARRLEGPGGAFLGVLVGEIRLSYFESIYSHIGLVDGAGLTLLRDDGLVLVQYPSPPGSAMALMPAESPWYGAVQAGGGAYRSPGYLHNGTRLVSVHPLSMYPVVVDASLAEDAAFALWWRQTRYLALGALCAAVCILFLFRALSAQFRGMEQLAHDMSESAKALRESESRLLVKSRMLETTLEHMDQGLIMVNADRDVAVYNRHAAEMLDLPAALLAKNPPFAELEAYQQKKRADPAADARIYEMIRAATALARPCTFERHRPNGRDIEVRNVPVAGGGFVRTFTDITERRAAEKQVRYVAHHDGLTGLANRLVLHEHLDRELALPRRGESLAVLCLDLDQFKNVNDMLGHPAGDLLLRAVAERLRGCVREGDVVARLGGDEFAIVQASHDPPTHTSLLAERVIDMLRRPFDLDGHEVVISTSLGIAVGPTDGTSADALLTHADMALYRAKAAGRGLYRFFEPAMDAQVQARRALETDLRTAVGRGEFELFFQPMLTARTARLCGFEALIRWRHPRRGLVQPSEFIPLAEDIGLIIAIGDWALHEACRQAAAWPGDFKVAVNLSPVQFRSNAVVEVARSALSASGLSPGRLELEITESVLLQNTETTLESLHQLHDLGLKISMDDFGTGYSSLSYLRSFPFDSLKIDQSFIRDLGTTADSRAIVRAILELSRALGMSVTAEGVETDAQFSVLRAEGCNEVQGFLFGGPHSRANIPELIARLGAGAVEVV